MALQLIEVQIRRRLSLQNNSEDQRPIRNVKERDGDSLV